MCSVNFLGPRTERDTVAGVTVLSGFLTSVASHSLTHLYSACIVEAGLTL